MATPTAPSTDDATPWFRRAVFYEVLLRSYADSDGDGTGDFAGLTSKLDHLQWLGVDCLWVPPFYVSPLRDGGYDVADHTAVAPEYGTLDDFRAFLDAAHARGIRVLVDLVLNHTSDAHPWFRASRHDPEGEYGDFYVWADDDTGYPEVRVIFPDTEHSTWTWDEVRGQYFFHRFYSHQPDLNYDHPGVQEAMLEAVRFWLRLGVDGFRLDAVPYLYEREGTNGESLPETHAFLRRLRAVVEAEHPEAVLMCEANQWPEELVEYLGDPALGGDECHMALHFPLMPRLYLALATSSAAPISEILARTPKIPDRTQWGLFLRNHDELTLEMVTPAERDLMWATYAPEPRMVANVGIRRRLAPLLDNDRRRIELMHSLLLSLPGSPVLYYGDEIGMGDDIWLGDRDGVRTPMQWDDGPNGGFSTAAPEQLTLPVVDDPAHAPAAVNVAAQLANPASLLHWVRDTLAVRRELPELAVGEYTEPDGDNPAVLAFVRSTDDAATLCVHNLAGTAEAVRLDLAAWAGSGPVEPRGGERFPRIGTEPYQVTLPPYGQLWLRLTHDPG